VIEYIGKFADIPENALDWFSDGSSVVTQARPRNYKANILADLLVNLDSTLAPTLFGDDNCAMFDKVRAATKSFA